MIEHKDIHEAINAVMTEVGYVQKQKASGLQYTYAGEASLIEALRPSMVAHGIYMSVKEVKKIYREQYTTSKGTAMVNTMIHGVVRFSHVSGDFIDVESTGEGADSGDKSANKAMTGMYKYALRQTFCIETGDDPDRFPSESMERALKPVANIPQNAQNSPQKPSGATESENEATAQAEELSGGFLPKDLKLAENVVMIKDASGKPIPEVMKVLNKLDKSTKYTVGQVVKLLAGETE